jgi:hypothetical protein
VKVRDINGLMERGPQTAPGGSSGDDPNVPGGGGPQPSLRTRDAQIGQGRDEDNNGGDAPRAQNPPSLTKRVAQFQNHATGSGVIIDGIDQPQAQGPHFVEARDAQSGRADPPPADPTPGLKSRSPQVQGRIRPGDNNNNCLPSTNPFSLKARNPQGDGSGTPSGGSEEGSSPALMARNPQEDNTDTGSPFTRPGIIPPTEA